MHISRQLLTALGSAAIASLVAATPVHSGDLYIGAGAYWADSDVGDDTVPAGFLGYTFLDSNFLMLSVEAGYYDLGDSSNRKEKVEASAITAGGVVSLPLGPFFELYAKGGVAFTDVKRESADNKDKDKDEKAYYGVGVSLDMLDTIDIYLEYLVFDTNIDSEMAGIGIKLSF